MVTIMAALMSLERTFGLIKGMKIEDPELPKSLARWLVEHQKVRERKDLTDERHLARLDALFHSFMEYADSVEEPLKLPSQGPINCGVVPCDLTKCLTPGVLADGKIATIHRSQIITVTTPGVRTSGKKKK
jgi:hypothetical protein